jgi:hypothetical protein
MSRHATRRGRKHGIDLRSRFLSVTMLVVVYLVLVVFGAFSLLSGGLTLLSLASLVLNAIVLAALLQIGDARMRRIGLTGAWLKIVLGGALILFGFWEILTLSPFNGIMIIALGAITGLGLGYWTVTVIREISLAKRRQPAAVDG